jgi:hypothetical protein
MRWPSQCFAVVLCAAACGSTGTAGTGDVAEEGDLPSADVTVDTAGDSSGDAAADDAAAGDKAADPVGDAGERDVAFEEVSDVVDDVEEEDGGGPSMEPLFAFAVIADPHVTSSGEHADRLEAAVTWINEHLEERMIELVIVVGDVCWSDGMDLGRALLDDLMVPYVPITGDNEIHGGDEELFFTTFSDHWDSLSAVLDEWRMAEMPVWNPEAEQDSWFTNVAFEYRGLHFVGVDWSARGAEGLAREMGDLHDFEGGTWPWFEEAIEGLPEDTAESIVLFSHIPMHFGMFWFDEMDAIEALLGPYADTVYANVAGHVHMDYERTIAGGGYVVYAVDATWDDTNTVRLVTVQGDGSAFAYTHETVAVE